MGCTLSKPTNPNSQQEPEGRITGIAASQYFWQLAMHLEAAGTLPQDLLDVTLGRVFEGNETSKFTSNLIPSVKLVTRRKKVAVKEKKTKCKPSSVVLATAESSTGKEEITTEAGTDKSKCPRTFAATTASSTKRIEVSATDESDCKHARTDAQEDINFAEQPSIERSKSELSIPTPSTDVPSSKDKEVTVEDGKEESIIPLPGTSSVVHLPGLQPITQDPVEGSGKSEMSIPTSSTVVPSSEDKEVIVEDGKEESIIPLPGTSSVVHLPGLQSSIEVPVEASQPPGFKVVDSEPPTGCLKKQTSDVDFKQASKLIGEPNVWKRVGRQLGLEEKELNCIDDKEKDYDEKAYQMLLKWREQFPEQCTLRNLYFALKKEKFNDKANQLQNDGSLKSHLPRTNSLDHGLLQPEDLQKRLKDYSEKFTLPQLPWVEEGLEFTVKEVYSEQHLSTKGEDIKIEDIFKHSEKPMKRLLIEGQPGIGKTTLVTKLAYDWAVGEEYMQKYAFVFVIKLKEIEDKDVPLALYDIAKNCGISEETLLRELETHSSRTLILLDGLDEIPDGTSRKSTMDVLYQRSFSDATIAVTCRNGMFEIKNEDRNLSSITPQINMDFWDKKIDVNGLTQNGTANLIGKIFSESQAKVMSDKLKGSDSEFRGICKSPLNLTLLGYLGLHSNDDDIDFHTTRTKIYSNVLKGLADYNFKRKGETIETDFDSFSGPSEMFPLWREKLIKFGKFCFKLIKNSSEMRFDNSPLIRKIYDLGFLTKNDHRNPFKKINYFEPFHRSFVEYFAAFYVSQQYLSSEVDQKIVDEMTADLQDIDWKSSGTSLVLPFIAGIMGCKVNELFVKLSPYAHIYKRLQKQFWRIVEECEQSVNVCDSLIQLLPENIIYSNLGENNPRFLSSNLFKRVIEEWMKQCNSSCFTFYTSKTDHLQSFSGHVRTIVLKLYDLSVRKNFEHYSSALNKMSCSQLVFEFDGLYEKTSENSKLLGEWLSLKTKLNADQLLLINCNSSVCELLLSNRELSRGEDLFLLHCELDNNDNWDSIVSRLFVNYQIHSLILHFVDDISEDVLSTIIESISENPSCASFEFKGYYYLRERKTIDLSSLCKCVDKPLKFVSLNGFDVNNNHPNLKEIKVNTLKIFYCEIDPTVFAALLNSDIISLICDSCFILQLIDQFPNGDHPIHSSLCELSLILWTTLLNEESWHYLTNFRNVKTLCLYAYDLSDSLNCAIDCLQSMELSSLQFRFTINDCNQKKCVTDMCSLIYKLKINESFSPPISVVLEMTRLFNEELKEGVIEILNLLNEGLVNKIMFDVEYSEISSNLCWRFSWIDVKKFEIKYEYLTATTDSRHLRVTSSKHHFRSDYFTITKRHSQLSDISGPSKFHNISAVLVL